MNPKCYKSAILPFSGRGRYPGEISHIISSPWMPRTAGILGLLLILGKTENPASISSGGI
jgi:hypothetical protein